MCYSIEISKYISSTFYFPFSTSYSGRKLLGIPSSNKYLLIAYCITHAIVGVENIVYKIYRVISLEWETLKHGKCNQQKKRQNTSKKCNGQWLLLSKASATSRKKDWGLDTVLWQKQWGKLGFQTRARWRGQEIGKQRWIVWHHRPPGSWEAAELQRDDRVHLGQFAKWPPDCMFCLAWSIGPCFVFLKKYQGLKYLRGNWVYRFLYR